MNIRARLLFVLLVAAALITACGDGPSPQAEAPTQATQAEQPQPIPTQAAATATLPPPTPTATPEPPAAARVNGQIISLETFQNELARFEAAQRSLGRDPAAEGTLYQVDVLDALIEQLLIEQAAASEGITVTDQELETELLNLIEKTGGQESFAQWLEMSQYSDEEFKRVLRSGMISQIMYERVTGQIPMETEQVHARHIVVDSVETGQMVLVSLQEGGDFASLAADYSLDESTRLNAGDLGFFPRGLLLSPEVEEAAFSLEVGATSDLITSGFGYHIIQVLERDSARSVSPEVHQRLREVAFQEWLQQLWAAATVVREI